MLDGRFDTLKNLGESPLRRRLIDLNLKLVDIRVFGPLIWEPFHQIWVGMSKKSPSVIDCSHQL